MIKTSFSPLSTILVVFALSGCTTSGADVDALDPAFASLPGVAPVPQAKPETGSLQIASADAGAPAAEDAPNPVSAVVSAVSYAANAVPAALAGNNFTRTSRDRECLMRAMYFESSRSSREGMLAVGTVVMNRTGSGKFPASVCGVVSQPGQFAAGVMSRRLQGDTSDLAALADDILAGKRHPGVRNAMHFHQAGLKFRYGNMHYVLNAGGNSFYEKRSRRRG